MVDGMYSEMLVVHKKTIDVDIMQMNNLKKVGISGPNIYNSFTQQSGGYERVWFGRRTYITKLTNKSDNKGVMLRLIYNTCRDCY